MAIISKSFSKKLNRFRRISDWWFTITKLRFMRKILQYLVKVICIEKNINTLDKLNVYPSDFRKLSNEQIERGLKLFVKRKELLNWEHIKYQNADGYLVVLPNENGSQERILNRIPEEIDLNNVNLEPLPQNMPEKQLEEHQQDTTIEAVNLEQVKEPTKQVEADKEDYSEPF